MGLQEHGGVRGEALFSLKDYVFKTQGIKKLEEFFYPPPKK
jgi:hypothetical protein